MLKLTETRNITGSSTIDGGVVETFGATIHTDDPANPVSVSRNIMDAAKYKENHEECLADQAAFEKRVYELQDRLIEVANQETQA